MPLSRTHVKPPVPNPTQGTCRNKKHRLLPGAVLLIVLLLGAAAGAYYFRSDPEPDLPPEQKIRINFRKAFNPEETTLERLASLRRSFTASRNIPAEKRHMVMVEVLAEAVNQSFADFMKLKPEQKAARAELLREDAERTLRYFRSLPLDKQRRALNLLANTPGGRAQLNRAIDTTANRLSPEDRKLLGPTIKLWKIMLEDVR